MSFPDILTSRLYHDCLRETFTHFECKSVLDAGCGNGQALRSMASYVPIRVGIEIYRPYLELRRFPKDTIVINGDLSDVDELFIDKSFDGVLISDVLEHFDKCEALELLNKLENIARKIVLLWIPFGEHKQNYDDTGMDNHFHQTHRSTWEPQEIENLGYTVYVWDNYHKPSTLKPDIDPRAGIAYKIMEK